MYIYIYIYTYMYMYMFLFCDGVCSTPTNVLLMFLFNLFFLGNIKKILIKISNELCETSQLKKGIMYLKAFVRMSK